MAVTTDLNVPTDSSSLSAPMPSETLRVAIIGGGPKGTYALERLTAHVVASTDSIKMEIYVFNLCSYFGAGNIYRPDQPDYLLMNFTNDYINMWTADSPKSVVPNRLTFLEWLQQKRSAKADGYAARAEVGAYLVAGFRQIVDRLPEWIKVKTVAAEVIDVQSVESGYKLKIKQDREEQLLPESFNYLLLTTGHPPAASIFPQLRNQFGMEATIPFIYPVTEKLSHLPADCKVAIKGMGLTFIDAVLALTEGYGGQFITSKNGSLQYLHSGAEPQQIYPFSRSGLPMIPRAATTRDSPRPDLRYFSSDLIRTWQQAPKVDFVNEILPLLRKEMQWAYYRVLFKKHDIDITEISEAALSEIIGQFHVQYPKIPSFDWNKFWNPLADQKLNITVGWHHFLTNYLSKMIRVAAAGEQNHPLAAVAAVWKYLTPLFGEVYSFSGLTAQSHDIFHRDYASHLNRITYGPPLQNMRKIMALVDVGMINLGFAKGGKVTPTNDSKKVRLTALHTDETVHIDYLIDARIPRPNLSKTNSVLYQNLLEKGWIRPFQNKDETGVFSPGCLEIRRETAQVVNQAGETILGIASYGTPTEGITYDNDSLSRKRNNFAQEWAQTIVEQIKYKNKKH